MSQAEKILGALRSGPKSFTQLKEETGLENGVIQHHIDSREEIVRRADAVMLRDECSNCLLKSCKSCIKTLLKDSRKKEIAEMIDEGKSQGEIAEELGLTKPTVNYHVQDLRRKNVLKEGCIRPEVKALIDKGVV